MKEYRDKQGLVWEPIGTRMHRALAKKATEDMRATFCGCIGCRSGKGHSERIIMKSPSEQLLDGSKTIDEVVFSTKASNKIEEARLPAQVSRLLAGEPEALRVLSAAGIGDDLTSWFKNAERLFEDLEDIMAEGEASLDDAGMRRIFDVTLSDLTDNFESAMKYIRDVGSLIKRGSRR